MPTRLAHRVDESTSFGLVSRGRAEDNSDDAVRIAWNECITNIPLIYLIGEAMTHVITGSCCNDAACVPACPVNCIHPPPEGRESVASEMLSIDPETCIDCGPLAYPCPVHPVSPAYGLGVAAEPSGA